MEKILNALNDIENVLKAVDIFETPVSSGDFEKRYATSWPDVKKGLSAVYFIKKELQKIQGTTNERKTSETTI